MPGAQLTLPSRQNRGALDADVREYVLLVALNWRAESAIVIPLVRDALAREQPPWEWLSVAQGYVEWRRRVGASAAALDVQIRQKAREKFEQVLGGRRAAARRALDSIEEPDP